MVGHPTRPPPASSLRRPFISFTISFGDAGQPLRVALTGDPAVEEVLRTEFGSRVVLPMGSLVRR